LTLSRQLSYEFAVVAILCTVALFLFPAVQGPYSAVHGPVTALLSFKARVFICLALLLAAMHLFARYVAVCQLVLRISLDGPFLPLAFDSKHPAVLRC
jgi:hypothetical protein